MNQSDEKGLSANLEAKRRQILSSKQARSEAEAGVRPHHSKLKRVAWILRAVTIALIVGLYLAHNAEIIALPVAFFGIAVLGGFVLGVIGMVTKDFALDAETDAAAAAVLTAQAKGLVTGVSKEQAGAVGQGAGFTYRNVYSVEFEGPGGQQTIQDFSKMATNMEGLLEREAERRLGSIVDVHFEPGNPTNAIVGDIPRATGVAAIVYLVGVVGWYAFLSTLAILFIARPPEIIGS